MIVVGLAGVVSALGLLFVLSQLAGGNDDNAFDIRLGDDRFDAGGVQRRADTIARDGPLFFADLVTANRPIVLQHLGDDPQRGWYAFSAVAPGTDDCVLTWQPETEQFADCTDTPWLADGTGLEQFGVSIEDGSLFIDLKAGERTTSTSPGPSAPAG